MEYLPEVFKIFLGNTIVSATIATLLAALVIFFFKEYVKVPPDLSGTFHIECKTLYSKRNPYIGLTSIYTLNIINNNNFIEGCIEKTCDIENDLNVRSYIGKDRNRGEVKGVIKRNYLRRNQISLHVKMQGEKRESSIFIVFNKINTNKMAGVFWATAADSTGTVRWEKSEL